jgi:hypothetical protein
MARLQILELPEGDGDDRPPFVLVVDQVNYDTPDSRSAWLEDWADTLDKMGARTVLVFEETIEIPANDVPVDPDGHPIKFRIEPDFETFREQVQEEVRYAQGRVTRALQTADVDYLAEAVRDALGITPGDGPADIAGWLLTACRELKKSEAARHRLREDRDEARNWARHGYEIGQKHCGWTDHGVAPTWLTEGWPPHIDSCERLRQAAEYDEALTRVRNLTEEPEITNAQEPNLNSYLHGYGVATRIAKRAACSQQVAEESSDTERSPEE